MAAKKKYTVTVEKNPEFCGIGAGGVQFAHGKAVVEDDRLANWFKEHEGYKVMASGTASGEKDADDNKGGTPAK